MAVFTKYWMMDSVILLISFIVLAYFYVTRKFKYWEKRGVIEIKPTPFLGNFGDCLTAKRSAGQWLQSLYNHSTGLPYMGFYIFDKPALLVRDPELIKNIFVRDSNIFQNRFASTSPNDPLGFTNLFFIKNPAWKLLRSKLTPSFTSGKLKRMFELSNGKITYDLTMTLPYLDMIVAETLRKYPSLPFLDRVANEDYKIPDSDFVIEKGTPNYIALMGLHYDPQYFPDPHKFDPERFSAENKKSRKPSIYMPFGDGPHTCIGMRIGLLQTKLGLIKLLSKYEFSPCEKTSIPMRLTPKSILVTADGGIILNVKKITNE